jgi:uncharacterized protein YggE
MKGQRRILESKMKNSILTLALLTAPGLLLAETELKGSPEELRQFLHPVEHTVTLTGTHEETAFSDKAIVSLVITTKADRLGDSMEANTRLRTTIAQALIDAGVDREEINTSKFSSSPQFGWFGSKPKSFEVVNRMSVGITDEAHLQLLAGLTDNNDEVVMAGMEFEHTAREELQESVKASALDKALAQKTVIEERLGVTLVPIGFNERVVMPAKTQGAGYIEEVVVTAARAKSESRSQLASIAPSPPQQTFDEVKYQATIFVTFKVAQE